MGCPLEAKIQSDLVAALKNRDNITLSVLRMLKASLQLAITEKARNGDLTDEEIYVMIRKAVKQREEAAEQYRKGNALDRAAEELEEARILRSYLPKALEDSELEEIVQCAIQTTGAADMKDMGRVMNLAMQEIHGRADGKKVREVVQKLLAN